MDAGPDRRTAGAGWTAGSARPTTVSVCSGMAAVAFLALTWLVATGRTAEVDTAVYEAFRPGGTWAGAQELFGNVVDGLQPAVCLVVLLAVTTYSAWRQRSWYPLVFVTLLVAPTLFVIVGTKTLVDRVDPAGGLAADHGSYPSGHAAVVLVASAGVAMLIERPVRWWARLVVAAVCVLMALSLLWVGLHWFSDVVGGTLVGIVVLSLACLLPVQGFRSRSESEAVSSSASRDRAADLPGLHNG